MLFRAVWCTLQNFLTFFFLIIYILSSSFQEHTYFIAFFYIQRISHIYMCEVLTLTWKVRLKKQLSACMEQVFFLSRFYCWRFVCNCWVCLNRAISSNEVGCEYKLIWGTAPCQKPRSLYIKQKCKYEGHTSKYGMFMFPLY